MEACPDSKFRASGEPTEISRRATQSLMSIPSVDVEFCDTTLEISCGIYRRQKKTVLRDVSGRFKSGELTAILGPSGAGKSSLLRVLTGFITKGVAGNIRYNGRMQERKETCFIMQEDCFAPVFTVYEIMTICANFKLGRSLLQKTKLLLVEDILDMMSLTTCKDTRCNRLSGGQKKRLSIALELISNPPVMFLDEPTTGLDSVSALQCVRVLKALAKGGRTVVCTIHQPCASIINMFDHVYILCDGQCVYQGASHNILPYLRQFGLECPKYHNPADFVIEVVSGDYGSYHTQLIQAAKDDTWKKSRHVPATESVQEFGCLASKNYLDTAVVPIRPSNEFQKFCILVKLYYKQLYRDWSVSHLKVLLHVLVGGLIGVFFSDGGNNGSRTITNLSYFFVCIMYLSYTTMLPAVIRYPLERVIVVKEQFNNWYRLRTYYIAMTLSSIPVQLFYCVVNISLSYVMSDQPLEWQRFTMILLMYFMCVLVSEGFGIFFGILFNPVTGTFFGAISCAFFCLFGGFLIQFPHMPRILYWLSYSSFYRFCYDGIVTAMYGYDRPKLECPEDVQYCHLSSPEYILKLMDFSGDSYWINFAVLLLILVFVRFVAYYTLKKLSTGN